jgi:hypothetical protein
MRIKTAAISLALLLILTSGCAIVHRYGPYYGKVVDAETKEPLEGAAVLVKCNTQGYGPGGSVSRYVDAQETVTDKNGEFRIPAFTVWTFRPLQNFESYVRFTMFKPGYSCFPDCKGVKPDFKPSGNLPKNEFVTIELPKLKTIEERRKNLFDLGIDYDIPYKKQKKTFDLRNVEATQLGKEPWPIPESGGVKNE